MRSLLVFAVLSLIAGGPSLRADDPEREPGVGSETGEPESGVPGGDPEEGPPASAGAGAEGVEIRPSEGVRPPRREPVAPTWEFAVETEDRWTIAATYYRPVRGPTGLVILLHMHDRDREQWHNTAVAIQEAGYAAVTLDLRGHGGSTRYRGRTVRAYAFEQRDFEGMSRDVAVAIDHLFTRPEIDPLQIGIVGAGLGADVALRYAAERPDGIRSLVLLSPRWSYRQLDVREAVERDQGIPALVLAGEEEDFVGDAREIAEALAAGNPKSRIDLLGEDSTDAAHAAGLLHGRRRGARVERAIVDWITDNVRGP